MAEIFRATITPTKLELLAGWIGRQRWYAAKGHTPRLRQLWSWRLDDPAGTVGIEVLVVADEAGPTPVVYQVPLTYRGAALDGGEHALLGTTDHSVLGRRWVYDAPHDPVFTTQLLELVLGRVEAQSGSTSDTPEPAMIAHHSDGLPELRVTGTHVLAGEQSNTSIIYDTVEASGAPHPVICKLFRVLHDGENPDVVLQGALAASGCDRVPAPVGDLVASWPDATGAEGTARGHVTFVQEYLPGVQDAWREALLAARADRDFSFAARALGAVTAEVHQTLARVLPVRTASAGERSELVDRMRSRFRDAVETVPALADSAQQVERIYAAAEQADWPPLQRIHGDYHLGQVLDAPGRGWTLLDFEGEPLRPLAHRSAPDLPLRDVAGMLRSLDYAAGSVAQQEGLDRAKWAATARTAFLEGYAQAVGRDPRSDPALLDALELDKALYEVVYEARNRPAWISIPTIAIARLAAGPRSQTVSETPPLPPLPVDRSELVSVVAGTHRDPHAVLGPHRHEGHVTFRTLRPLAETVTALLADGTRVPLAHEFEGIWAGAADLDGVPDYRLLVSYGDGYEHHQDDPYRFLPTLGEMDLHLIGEGRHEQLWTVLGAHIHRYGGPLGEVRGTSFAVWAPHARAVRLIGEFNQWNGLTHPMRSLGPTGVWELFVPDVHEGQRYKFEILGARGVWHAKADPLARASEAPPATASVVTSSAYGWQDEEWLERRRETKTHEGPMSVYEVHLGSWRQGESYRELADHLSAYVADLGFTHIELMPVMEHPYGPSWGYQVTGYYSPTARYGTPDDFRYFVDTMHRAGIGVILDWVPAHFPKDAFALARFDGQALYEHPDPRRGDQPDWGTHVFNFGQSQVRNFLVANALYWLEEFHIDGLRVDAVASMVYLDYSRNAGEWVPNIRGGREHLEAVALLQEVNATAYKRTPGIVTIAEESTSWPGVTASTDRDGLGFGLKWNMGWMHDSLDYMAEKPINRQYHHTMLTFPLMYAWSEHFVLPISHDEVVHGKGSLLRKMPGDRWQQLANLRAYLAYMWSQPGKQLLFMGCEFGQESEWAESRSLDWWLLQHPTHSGVHSLVRDLNAVYRSRPALWELDADPSGFQWLEADDHRGNTLTYLRFGRPDESGERPVIASLLNFSGQPHGGVRVGLPYPGRWNEIVNTDAEIYGGSGVGNLGSVVAEEHPWQGQPCSAVVTLPPLGGLWLEPDAEESGQQPGD